MKFFVSSVLVLSFIGITTQDIAGRKGCDCSICNGVNNKLNPIVGRKISDDDGGKSSCNICEKRKEMLRLEKEKQQKFQKCPFEILGAPAIKGKTSEEIFDEFREAVVPSQNGFFDMMRGIVRTMHFSSEAELKYAKEKEAQELAKKKKQEIEEAKKRKLSKAPKDELVSLSNPVNPKVTVVLKQTPCGQIIAGNEKVDPEKVEVPLMKRLPKEVNGEIFKVLEEEVLNLQPIDFGNSYHSENDYLDLNSKDNLLNSDLIDHLVGYNMLTSVSSQNKAMETPGTSEKSLITESSTESPFVKFVSNEEMKALSRGDDIDRGLNLLPTSLGVEMQEIDSENAQNLGYSIDPAKQFE